MNKEQFLQKHPKAFFLSNDKGSLTPYLKERSWLQADEQIETVESAGEGNMNCTLRITTNERSFIIKQSRSWVEKYNHIPAPAERALMEGKFYQYALKQSDLAKMMPELLGVDENSFILIMEDLGEAQDFISVYREKNVNTEHLQELANYLGLLHKNFTTEETSPIRNLAMRQLNHEHIFHLPLQQDNGLDLEGYTPGLTTSARELQNDANYSKKVKQLGELYLRDGKTLLHGDYYPGSWLNARGGIKVIDPEFCFFGPAEFDVGVAIGHALLANLKKDLIQLFLQCYSEHCSIDKNLALQFSGAEIMRRLIGVAQLPLDCDLDRKIELLKISHQLVTKPEQGDFI